MLRGITAWVVAICTVALAAYVGPWIMFVGGIVDVVEAAKATPVEAVQLGVGILKAVLARPVTLIVVSLGFFTGSALAK